MDFNYIIVLLCILLVFILSLAIIMAVKNRGYKLNNRNIKKVIGIIILIIIFCGLVFSGFIFASSILKGNIFDSVLQFHNNDENVKSESSKKVLNNVVLPDADFREIDYEKLFCDIREAMNLEGEMLFHNIDISVNENNRIRDISFSFIEIKNERYCYADVYYSEDYDSEKMNFIYHSSSDSYEFDKSFRKQYMKIEDAAEIITKYIKVINIKDADVSMFFDGDKCTSTEYFYNSNDEDHFYDYYIVDFDNLSVSKMPHDYKYDQYGIFSVFQVTQYKDDNSHTSKYVYEW